MNTRIDGCLRSGVLDETRPHPIPRQWDHLLPSYGRGKVEGAVSIRGLYCVIASALCLSVNLAAAPLVPPTPSVETSQRIEFNPLLSPTALVLLALLLVGLAGWLARRDRLAGERRPWVPLLLVFRLTALAILLWMMTGPSNVTVVRRTEPQTVAVVLDSSGSMGLVDSIDGAGNNLRWTPSNPPILKSVDAGLGALAAAKDHLKQACAATEVGRFNDLSVRLQLAHAAVQSAATALGQTADPQSDVPPSTTKKLESEEIHLREVLVPVLADRLKSMRNRPAPTALQARETLLSSLSLVEQCFERVRVLSDSLAAAFEAGSDGARNQNLSANAHRSRVEKAGAWLSEAEDSWLSELGGKVRLLRYHFGEDVFPVAPNEWTALADPSRTPSHSTDLATALRQLNADALSRPLAAALIITDGGHNTPADLLSMAATLQDLPLQIVPMGNTRMQRDVILHHVQGPRALFKDDRGVVEAMVTAYDCQGEPIQVEISKDGQKIDSQLLFAHSDLFDARVSFQWPAIELGSHELLVKAVPLADERTTENNEAIHRVEVMEDTIRVLLADHWPRWEFRYLANLFKRDERIEFEQLLFEPSPSGQAPHERPTFPRNLDAWRRYRVIILGDVTPEQFPPHQQELLRQYIAEEGGNLVVVAGRDSMPQAFLDQPLGAMLPATMRPEPLDDRSGFALHLTAEGEGATPTQLMDDPLSNARVWNEMSRRLPIYNLSPVSRAKPTAHLWIAATPMARSPSRSSDARSFLSWHFAGRGRVVYLAAPISYQLRYLQGDRLHHRFWGQLLRWIVARDLATGSRTVRLTTDKLMYDEGDAAEIVLRLSQLDGRPVLQAHPVVRVQSRDRVVQTLELEEQEAVPGAYRATLPALTEGVMTLTAAGETIESLLQAEGWSGAVETKISVGPPGSTELRHPLCNLSLLEQLSSTAGASVLPPTAVPDALAHLDLAPDVHEESRRQPLWNRWLWLWLFVGCVTLEWIGRKWAGLS